MRSCRFICWLSRRPRLPAACRPAVQGRSPATLRRCGKQQIVAAGDAAARRDARSARPVEPQPVEQHMMAQPIRSADAGRAIMAWSRRPIPTRSIPATSCASWCSARKASPPPIRSTPAATSRMPLIGAVKARGMAPAGLQQAIAAKLRERLRARAACRGRGRGLPAVLHPRRGHPARPVSLRAEHDGRDRGRDRGRLHAARLQAKIEVSHQVNGLTERRVVSPNYPVRPGDTVTSPNAGSDRRMIPESARSRGCGNPGPRARCSGFPRSRE